LRLTVAVLDGGGARVVAAVRLRDWRLTVVVLNGGGARVVAAVRDWRLNVAVLHGGCRCPGAWSHDWNARHDLAGAEDLGERDSLERDVDVRGNALEQRHTFREHVFLLRVRVEKLRSAAEDDLAAVVIVKEQLEVIWEKLACEYRW